MVMLQLPPAHELTPWAGGERTVAGRLIGHVRPGELVLTDKGFRSHGLFQGVQNPDAWFTARLGAGVEFETVKSLGRDDRLVKWTPSDRRWKAVPKSTTLRVIGY